MVLRTWQATTRLRVERVEDRLTPSGFGPEDGAYIVEPWLGSYSEIRIQPGDQKIVTTGMFNPNGDYSDTHIVVARYDSSGNPDTTYGTGAPFIAPLNGVSVPALGATEESGHTLVLQADGRAVVAGNASGASLDMSTVVARFNTDGTLDGSFGSGGWNTINVSNYDTFIWAGGVGLQSTGKVVVAGSMVLDFPQTSASPAYLARFTTSGAVDSGKGAFGQVTQGKALGYTLAKFGTGNSGFSDVVVLPGDKLLAVGTTSNSGSSNSTMVVARYTANGVLDTTFNGKKGYATYLPAGCEWARGWATAVQPDGKIVVSGPCKFTGGDGEDVLVVRFNANGSLDTGFGGGTGFVRLDVAPVDQSNEFASDVVIQPDGKILICGSTGNSSTGNLSKVLVVRLNANGTPDATFGPGGIKLGTPLPDTGYHWFEGYSMDLQSDGSIIVAGAEDSDSDPHEQEYHPLLMRFYGTSTGSLMAKNAALAQSQPESLTPAQVQPLLTEAVVRWQAAGVDVSSLQGINLRIVDLPGTMLGQAAGRTLMLDANGAGWGWFVDRTPRNDSEFTTQGNQGEQNRMDLLSVIVHEMGHLLGHNHDEGGVMAETLTAGTRNNPVHTIDSLAAIGLPPDDFDFAPVVVDRPRGHTRRF